MTRNKVFISYSHRDKRWLTRLQKMLKPLVRKGTISLWADTEIQVGASWREEIERALASALPLRRNADRRIPGRP